MPVGTQDANSIPWDPNNTSFPSRKDLLRLPDAPEDAAWVWGKDDYCGRLNLLTPNRIRAASTYIKTGELIPMDLPTSIPATPAAGRLPFKHEIKALAPGLAYDDIYALNTQSSTQWDGFRHVAHTGSRKFYNGVTAEDFAGSDVADLGKGSIHHWRDQIGGITGRGILLDYRSYADSLGLKYDSASGHSISYDELEACGKWQGIDIRPASRGGDIQVGDVLFIRSGWVQDYYHRSEDENRALALRSIEETTFAGVKQEEKMVDWLHDCYFAAVAGDAPGFERWPTEEKWMLHEYLLALWGIPIGEMVDLERVSEVARREGRWTFFFTSAPFRTIGGIASFLNATAIF